MAILAEVAGPPTEELGLVLVEDLEEYGTAIDRAGPAAADHGTEHGLRRPFLVAGDPVLHIDHPCQPGGLGVAGDHVPHGCADPRVGHGRRELARDVRLNCGVRVDVDDQVAGRLADRGDLRLTLSDVAREQYEGEPWVVGVGVVDTAQPVAVSRSVVDQIDCKLSLVVLGRHRPQAFREDQRVLVVTGDNHVHRRQGADTRRAVE